MGLSNLRLLAWNELLTSELTNEERLFKFVFRMQNGRQPEPWEKIVGLAFVDNTLSVQWVPGAPELRRVHDAASGVKAALGLFQ